MKFVIAYFLLTVAAFAAANEPATPLAQLAPLAGGVWVADLAAPGGGAPLKLEAHFEWAENRQAMRFTSAFIRNGQPAPYTSGFYAWDPVQKKVAIFYADNHGSLVTGLATSENGVLAHELSVAEPNGTTSYVRTRLTVKPDELINEIFVKKGDEWAPLVTARYVRQK